MIQISQGVKGKLKLHFVYIFMYKKWQNNNSINIDIIIIITVGIWTCRCKRWKRQQCWYNESFYENWNTEWHSLKTESLYPNQDHTLHLISPHLALLWLILCLGAVIPEPLPSTGFWLSASLCPPLSPASASPHSPGWHHQLWQENKSTSSHLSLVFDRCPWQFSINSLKIVLFSFFFFSLSFFNLQWQMLEPWCQHNWRILAGRAPPGPNSSQPVPSL